MVRRLLRVSHRNKIQKENTHIIDRRSNITGIAYIFPQHFRLESFRHLFEHDARPVQSNKSIPISFFLIFQSLATKIQLSFFFVSS